MIRLFQTVCRPKSCKRGDVARPQPRARLPLRRNTKRAAASHRPPTSRRNGDAESDAADGTCRVALLLVDVINDMVFPGSNRLVRQALPMARRLAELKRRARRAKIPSIYINDNFGR